MSDVTSRAWWRWMEAMRYRYHDLDEWDRVETLPDGRVRQPIGAVPDETDPATLGCLLARARELWGVPTACTGTFPHHAGLDWYVSGLPCGVAPTRAATEFAALLAACDAAPGSGA